METNKLSAPQKCIVELAYKDRDTISLYMDDAMSEETFMQLKLMSGEIKKAKYGLIANNWHLNNVEVSWVEYYGHLIDKQPTTQEEFDEIQAKIDGTWEDWTKEELQQLNITSQ